MADQDKYVYRFSEGTRQMKNLLGGRGSGLAEMSNLGLPGPPWRKMMINERATIPTRRRFGLERRH